MPKFENSNESGEGEWKGSNLAKRWSQYMKYFDDVDISSVFLAVRKSLDFCMSNSNRLFFNKFKFLRSHLQRSNRDSPIAR